MKTLILTEKPSVARDFAKALGVTAGGEGYLEDPDYIITWAVGHLVELFEPEEYDAKWKKWRMDLLPILPQDFQYKPISKTEKQLSVIKRLIREKKPERIVVATDAGREGEVIARTILLSAGVKGTKNMQRFWTSQALTPKVIQDNMNSLKEGKEYDRLWRAGQSRQIADWLVGMNCSRAATLKMDDLFTVGRVQTAVLSLLVDRRKEREDFKPEPYWLLRALFSNEKGTWQGLWFRKKETQFKTEDAAQKTLDAVKGENGEVQSVKKQKKSQPPPFLYSLTDLQREANGKYGFTAKRTLEIAQSLYEDRKCLSYPRTDSRVLGTQNEGMVKSIVSKLSATYPEIFKGIDNKLIQKSNTRVFNDAKLTDHHALIPLGPLPERAEDSERKIFLMVLRRFAAAFHPDCRFEQTDIVTQVKEETFRTRGKIVLDQGWQVLYQNGQGSKKGDREEALLPPLEKGDPALVEKAEMEKKKTLPPPEYTDALLLKEMTNPGRYVEEDELKKIYRGDVGLGTQATRAQTIETLLFRKYAQRRQRNLVATDKGSLLIGTLRKFKLAKNLASPEETARWESRLEQIARGKGSHDEFLEDIRAFVEKSVTEFKSTDIGSGFPLGSCPKCGGEIIRGKKGFGCSNWRKEDGACRFVIWQSIQGKTIGPHIVKQLVTEKKAGPFYGFISQEGKPFNARLILEIEGTDWEVRVNPTDDPPEKSKNPEALGVCPACGGDVVEGTKGFGCANWRDKDGGCKFVIWKTIAQKKISKKVAKILLEKGHTEKIEGFISRKGNEFGTKLKIAPDESGVLKIIFDFSDN